MPKQRNLKYLTEVLGQNAKSHLTFPAPIDTVLQKRHSSYRKYHFTKMAPNLNGTSQKWHLTTMASLSYIIGFLKYYRHPSDIEEPSSIIRHRKVIGILL